MVVCPFVCQLRAHSVAALSGGVRQEVAPHHEDDRAADRCRAAAPGQSDPDRGAEVARGGSGQ